MNDYETRRLQKIKANQALLAELDIKPVVAKATRSTDSKPPPAKKRKVVVETTPSRTSARIASAPAKSIYNDEPVIKAVRLSRSLSKKRKAAGTQALGSTYVEETESLVPVKDVESIRAGWTSWEATGAAPTRDESSKTFHFDDFPDFTPNKSPAEMLREGCFGGGYYRPLRSRKLGIVIEDDYQELPTAWIEGLDPSRFLISPIYSPDINKYKVACGQSIEEWEAAGWISHEHDVRGWFQWYTRFFLGRRCDDDERQVSRWKKCVGETGRWRRMLLKKYVQLGVKEVFDDGADEDAPEHGNKMHTPADCTQGILIRPLHPDTDIKTLQGVITLNKHHAQILVTSVPKTALEENEEDWIPLPLTTKLGIDLLLRPSNLSDGHRTLNYAAQLLTLEPDPKDPEFGQCVCDELYSDVLIVRKEGQSLGGKPLKALLKYVQDELEEVRLFFRLEDEARSKAKAKELVERKITGEAFERFKERRREG